MHSEIPEQADSQEEKMNIEKETGFSRTGGRW